MYGEPPEHRLSHLPVPPVHGMYHMYGIVVAQNIKILVLPAQLIFLTLSKPPVILLREQPQIVAAASGHIVQKGIYRISSSIFP